MPTDNELAKKLSGGAITKAEYDRLMAMPHKDRYDKNKGLKERSGAAVTPKELSKQKATAKSMRKKTATGSTSVGSY